MARRQLRELGCAPGWIEKRVRRGLLLPVHQGVYAVGRRLLSQDGRWMAAVLASGENALLSHRSAARLWQVIPTWRGEIEVTRPQAFRRRSGIRAHQASIAEDERSLVDGIPVTSPFRTIFDLAAVLKMRELERAFHEAEVRGLWDRVSLPMLLERYPGRRGARKVRALLDSDRPVAITRNDFEEGFVALVDAHGLPRPRMNAPLAVRARLFEIDALWERERVAVELDSRSVHATKKNFESDRQRDRILLAEGWRTMRVTWRQLEEEPDEVAADIRLAFSRPALTHPH